MSVNGYFGGEGAMKQEVKERSAEMRVGAVDMDKENLPEPKTKRTGKKQVKQSLED